jgi:CRISPR/Cas system endoribonuclease Cas6 (RAMP superfamily)
MQELYLLSPLLIKTINEKLDQPYVKEIRFKHVGFKNLEKNKLVKKIIKKNKTIQLTKEDEHSIAKIADPALRDALKAFRIRCYEE